MFSSRSNFAGRALYWGAASLAFPLAAASAQETPPSTSPDPAPEEAVPAAPSEEELLDAEEIVVVGQRTPGAVIGDIPPENQLNARDIRAYGASTVAELLEAISPQTGSARGRGGGAPVTLVNGRRISSFREIRDLPPEAILRVDILPEEVALNYGYSADQRVVNIVLRPRFRSTTARAEAGVATEGGRSTGELDVTRLMLNQNGRTTLNVHAERDTALTEAERDIDFQPDSPDAVDPRELRTLLGSRRLARVGGTVNRTIFGDVSSTLDGQVEYTDGRGLLGPSLLDLGEPLRRDSNTMSAHAGLAFNGQKQSWRWSLTGAYDLARSRTETDRESEEPAGYTDQARTTNSSGNLDLVLNGPLVQLPAGRANVTLRAGADTRDLNSSVRRAGVVTKSDLGRDRLSTSANVDLPLAERGGSLGVLGDLTLNANAEVEQLSDFGTLTTIGAGAYWSPVDRLNIIASWTGEEGAPSLNQLGDPLLVTPDTRVFDFVRGETALVEAITGGNPELDADKRQVWKLGGTLKPWDETDFRLRADYVHTTIDDPIARFPGPTAAIEAAFPERFVRDATGNLISVDLRPVNFDSSTRDELRWGFNFTKRLTSARPPQGFFDQIRRAREQAGVASPERTRGAGSGAGAGERRPGRGGGAGGGGGFGGGRQGGRLQLSIFHTLLLKNEVRIREGLPVVDYLNGDAGEGGGGTPRHRIEAEAGWFNNGLGARFSADWLSGSKVEGSDDEELRFSPLAKFNLRLFANLGERFELVTKYPWLRGTQIRLNVDNILDSKQRVRNLEGAVPVNYQPDLLDPLGRTVSISIRKLFLPPRSFFRRDGQRRGSGS